MRIADDQTLILGAPGCGKTTTLLNKLEELLAEGVPAHRIAYVSFTKKAVQEALDRTMARFGGTAVDYPYFRTLHSLCFRQMGIDNKKVFGPEQKKDYGKFIGVKFAEMGDEDVNGLTMGTSKEDWCLFVENLSRNRLISLQDQYNDTDEQQASYYEVLYMAETYQLYKSKNYLLDYTDMLQQYANLGEPAHVDVAIIDEAQDLSPLQWQVVKRAFSNCQKVFIAGDDDQAIHVWAGADIDTFLRLEGQRIVLQQSYRIPHTVWKESQRIVNRIKSRYPKVFNSRDEAGAISRYMDIDMLDPNKLEGSSLWLARHVYMLPEIEALLKSAGVVFYRRGGSTSVAKGDREAIYHWEHLRKGQHVTGKAVKDVYAKMESKGRIAHGSRTAVETKINPSEMYCMDDLKRDWGLLTDAVWFEALNRIGDTHKNYYLSILRNHGPKALMEAPKVQVNTIHGVKGGEADHVVLLTDMTAKTYEAYRKNPDNERRVFYVAVTRAKKHLHIVEPKGIYYFEG